MTAVTIRGKELDTASLGEIRVAAPDVDLAALSDVALLELGRCFAANGRKCRGRFVGAVKRELRGGIEQIGQRLAAEADRRRSLEPGPAAPLIVIFKNVEAAAVFASFLEGLRETYISQRAKVAPQGELERSIVDLRAVAFECVEFCRAIAAAIFQTELPEVQSFR
ncbi:MAG: hypothetical protein LAO03_22045 [Acidobacteriia bacterium]|nr:hypothetical protein [Terriglobia bacterium]